MGVNEGPINYIVKLDTSDPEYKIARVKEKADKVVRDWSLARAIVMRQIYQVRMAIGGIVTTFTAVLSIMGQTLTPIQTALVQMIQTTLQSILTVHRMIEAGSMGVMSVLTIAMSVSAIALSAMAYNAAIEGTETAQALYAQAQQAVMGLETTIMAMGGTGFG
jgi:hypothetical protein